MKASNYQLDQSNGHRTYETLTSSQAVEIPVTSTCLSIFWHKKSYILYPLTLEKIIGSSFPDSMDIHVENGNEALYKVSIQNSEGNNV
jgi:hypothetical protein